ncbi:MAG: hypothetical protein WAZ98_03300 [Cyclobacteriaceae bacterium]
MRTPSLFKPENCRRCVLISSLILLTLISAIGQDGVMPLQPDVMMKLVPDKIEGFNRTDQNKGRMIKIGTLAYSIVERNFSKQKRKVVVLLFDYNNAPIMYSQATKKWKDQPNVEHDTLVDRSIVFSDFPGRESSMKFNQSAQLALGINDRFYLIVRGEGVDLNSLRAILALFPLSNYPLLQRNITEAKYR